jgi:hypothetical protein
LLKLMADGLSAPDPGLPLRDNPIDGLPRLERTVFLLEPDPSEGVTHLTMGVGQPELHTARSECLTQIGQKLCAGEIDFGDRTEKKDDKPDGIWTRAQQLE